MAKYGEIALEATKIVTSQSLSPIDAWIRAAQEIYPDNPELQEKSCPKEAFLGLCEKGEVKGIPPGEYTNSVSNKCCALRALSHLRRENGDIRLAPDALWNKLVTGKEHNEQMDVVLTLVNSGHTSF